MNLNKNAATNVLKLDKWTEQIKIRQLKCFKMKNFKK